MKIAFVLAPRQNHFFVELVDAIRDELDQLGVATRTVVGDFPPEEPGLVYVLTPPHEWFALHGLWNPPTPRQLRRTLLLCCEQPGTSYFDDNAALAPFAGALFDISGLGVEELRRHGLRPHHFQLGWTRTWSTVEAHELHDDATAGRDVDVLHLGVYSDRRATALAAGATALAPWNAHLVLAHTDAPNTHARANFVVDGDKLALLRRTKVLLNLHQDERPYFEWMRVVQAMSQGCCVVSERAIGMAPLEPGEHLVAASARGATIVAAGLLEDEPLRARVAAAGYAAVREQIPLRHAVAQLADVAQQLAHSPGSPLARPLPQLTSPPATVLDLDERFPGPRDDDPELRQTATTRQALKDVRLELIELRRELQRVRRERDGDAQLAEVVVDAVTDGWRAHEPRRVSTITALYNHAEHVEAALESVLAGSWTDVELVVVDDGSTDGSNAAVRRFMARHPDVPVLLARHPVNRGLGHARNTALELARGELAFVLDADNEVHVHGLRRLVGQLDVAPQADFAYGILERFDARGPVGLVSCYPWEPRRLRNGNYIDAMALWRRDAIRTLGAYTTDSRLHGWEDYDLWCRCAERDVEGAFVMQLVARYRSTLHSMLSTTNLSTATAYSVLCERYPTLMDGVVPPP
jgi:hypothetical protein